MSSTTVKPTTIGVELEFLAVRGDTSLEDDRWPPKPIPEANPDYFDSESMLTVCSLIAKQNYQVTCLLNDAKPENPLIKTKDDKGNLVHQLDTEDGKFKIERISFDPETCNLKLRPDYRVWNIDFNDNPVELASLFTTWNVEQENSITSLLTYPALEIKTPIISKPKEQGHLLEVVELLRKNVKISTNPNCGMHIHAGYQSDPRRPFEEDLYRAKKVAAIVFLLKKPVILGICHPDRQQATQLKLISEESDLALSLKDNGSTHGPLRYNQNFGKGLVDSIRQFRSTLQNRCREEDFAFAFLENLFAERKTEKHAYLYPTGKVMCEEDLSAEKKREIEEFKEYRGFQLHLEDGSCMRTSLALSKEKKTLEFRYFETTFDSEIINFWIEFVRQLFSICDEPEGQFVAKFKSLYEMATRKEDEKKKTTWQEWLKALDLSEYEGTCARYIERHDQPLVESAILPKSFNSKVSATNIYLFI